MIQPFCLPQGALASCAVFRLYSHHRGLHQSDNGIRFVGRNGDYFAGCHSDGSPDSDCAGPGDETLPNGRSEEIDLELDAEHRRSLRHLGKAGVAASCIGNRGNGAGVNKTMLLMDGFRGRKFYIDFPIIDSKQRGSNRGKEMLPLKGVGNAIMETGVHDLKDILHVDQLQPGGRQAKVQDMRVNIILFVADQDASARFYESVLGVAPILHVPGMTEFRLTGETVLGLMPETGIRRLLGPQLRDPADAHGIPRAELYLSVPDPEAYHQRALANGATELSPLMLRNWGDEAAYSADSDGHILAFARLPSP